jgi:basic membrane lipoprotein Med (substrate-binding protein (PBP1-ABC) superfamily)
MMPKRMVLLANLLAAALTLSCCVREQAAPTLTPAQPQPTPTVAVNTPTVNMPTAVATPAVDIPDDAALYRVGLVTDGGRVDDGSMNQGVYQGMLRAGEEFAIETNFIETVQPGDFEQNIATFVNAGYDMVVTVGPLLGETTRAMAETYPDVRFVAVDGAYEAAPDNLMGLAFREDQIGFLAGALAGLVSESQTVGVVAGMDTPATRRLRSGYESGVRHVCAECAVLAIAIDSSTDPARGRTAALSQTAEDADVIFGVGGPTGSGAVLGAAQQGVWAIGVDQDEYYTTFEAGTANGSARLLSSAVKRADNAIYSVVKDSVLGIPNPDARLFDASLAGVDLAPFHDAESAVSDEIKVKLAEVLRMLASGELDTGVDPVSGEPLR